MYLLNKGIYKENQNNVINITYIVFQLNLFTPEWRISRFMGDNIRLVEIRSTVHSLKFVTCL